MTGDGMERGKRLSRLSALRVGPGPKKYHNRKRVDTKIQWQKGRSRRKEE